MSESKRHVSSSPYHFRQINSNLYGYLKGNGAECPIISPIKCDKLHIAKLQSPLNNTDIKLNGLIDALSAVGILSTEKESSASNIIAHSSPNYHTEPNAQKRVITKQMLIQHIKQAGNSQPNESDLGYFDVDFLTNTGANYDGETHDEDNSSLTQHEIAVLQQMVDEWNIMFESDIITSLQFLSAYAGIDNLQSNLQTNNTLLTGNGFIHLIDYKGPMDR